jgi:hypothetical protein
MGLGWTLWSWTGLDWIWMEWIRHRHRCGWTGLGLSWTPGAPTLILFYPTASSFGLDPVFGMDNVLPTRFHLTRLHFTVFAIDLALQYGHNQSTFRASAWLF